MTRSECKRVWTGILVCCLFSVAASGEVSRGRSSDRRPDLLPGRSIDRAVELAVERAAACAVSILNVKTGDKRGPDLLVTGKAIVPEPYRVAIYARKRGLQLWWPQGGGIPKVDSSNEYSALVTLGVARDLGSEFEILALVIDPDAARAYDAWFKVAEETGRYPGVSLPPAVENCGPPSMVTVIKAY